MIGHNEMTKERELRLEKSKKETDQLRKEFDELDIKYNSTVVQLNKTVTTLETTKKDLKDTTNKLHDTNKARHDTEIKLLEEIGTAKEMRDNLRTKDERIAEKERQIDDLDKKALDMTR